MIHGSRERIGKMIGPDRIVNEVCVQRRPKNKEFEPEEQREKQIAGALEQFNRTNEIATKISQALWLVRFSR
jgi:hypothetical protein